MLPTEITEQEFRKLADFIEQHYGIHLKPEKKNLLTGRLQSILIANKHQNFSDYINYLLADKTGKAVTDLVNKITTNHTFFMRESEHFFYFRDQVLPFLRSTVRDKDLRIWSAACSTGEEAYTLAMLIHEFFGHESAGWDTRILATDISKQVLEVAKKGIYSNDRVAPLPANWKYNYFRKADAENVVVTELIKNSVLYRTFNLVEPVFPFKRKFHAIFCRNVMIYFDTETKDELIRKLYEHMEYGGYLFIGHSESLNRETTSFKYIKPSIYRKM